MTLRDLERIVRDEVDDEAVRRFDAIMVLVADAGPTFGELGNLVHRRDGMQFRVSTSVVRKARNAIQVDVRVAGTSVGRLHVDGKDSREFEPHESNFRDLRDWEDICSWSEPRVASYINEVCKASLSTARPEFRPEARLEAKFVEAFDGGSKEPWARDLELVRVGRVAYQVPLPVGGSEKAEGGLGYIDALARFGRGHGLRVFELKKPSATDKEAVAAVRQAAKYALALKLLIADRNAMGYRRMFNFEGNVRDNLRFVITPFVPLATRPAVQEACANLETEPVEGLRLMPLYFTWDDDGSTFTVVDRTAGEPGVDT
jgi:hypothetical protein